MSRPRQPTIIVLFAVFGVILCSPTMGGADTAADRADPAEWQGRLEALDPTDPLRYFELAEEVADAARDQPQRDLARHLFALAGVLDPQRLGRSACLALADMEDKDHVKRRLLALASLLDERGGVVSPYQTGRAGDLDRGAALAVAGALSHYRKGRGARALTALRKGGAMELLETHGHVLRGGVRGFLEDCERYRPPRKPMLSEKDLITMLRFEAALLAGSNRSWSGELLLTSGQPLIEVDPDRLQDTLGVDGSKPHYRNGRWRSRGSL